MGLTLAAFLLGIIAGLRVFAALAAISWAARIGWLPLQTTMLGFVGSWVAPWIFTGLALLELVTDQLPSTPSRKVPVQFGARLVSGGFCGAAAGLAGSSWIIGLILGVIGAVLGAFAGAATRAHLAGRLGRDRPAAVIEDIVAIVGAALIVALA